MSILDLFRKSPEERVARRYMKALREAGEQRQLQYETANQLIVVSDGKGERQKILYLGNVRREVLAAPEAEHAAIYRRYASSHMEAMSADCPRDYAAVRPALRILLKDSGYPAYIALLHRVDLPSSTASGLVYELVAGDVIACCVEDGENSLRFVTVDDLVSWGVSATQALSDAKDNVCTLPCEIGMSGAAIYVFADDSFIAARLLNTAEIEQQPVEGAWVAVVPDRDTLFLTDSENMEGLAGLARLTQQQLEKGDRTISGRPLVLRSGQWQAFEPPEAVRVAFANVARQFRASRWSDYKDALEKEFVARGEDVFVASFSVYEEKDSGTCYSMAVWSRNVDTILPAVDRVHFHDGESQQMRVVLWPEVQRVMGTVLESLEGLPERYRVRAFPSSEQLVAMGARSV